MEPERERNTPALFAKVICFGIPFTIEPQAAKALGNMRGAISSALRPQLSRGRGIHSILLKELHGQILTI